MSDATSAGGRPIRSTASIASSVAETTGGAGDPGRLDRTMCAGPAVPGPAATRMSSPMLLASAAEPPRGTPTGRATAPSTPGRGRPCWLACGSCPGAGGRSGSTRSPSGARSPGRGRAGRSSRGPPRREPPSSPAAAPSRAGGRRRPRPVRRRTPRRARRCLSVNAPGRRARRRRCRPRGTPTHRWPSCPCRSRRRGTSSGRR